MDEQKQKAIASLEYEIKCCREQIDLIEKLPDGLPGNIEATFCGVHIKTPYNLDAIREIRAQLGSGYKVTHSPRVYSDGNWVMSLRGKDEHWDENILIIAQPDKPGSACRKVVDHYEQKPVYKIICDGSDNAAH